MKNIIIVLVTVLISVTNASGQRRTHIENRPVVASDSIALAKYLTEFFKAIEVEDTSKIRVLSLSMIDCELCDPVDYTKRGFRMDNLVEIDSFILRNVQVKQSRLLGALNERGYHLRLNIVHNHRYLHLPKDYGRNLKLFEVWIDTYLSNEYAPGHEGQEHAFQFIRYKGKFLFYGITSVP